MKIILKHSNVMLKTVFTVFCLFIIGSLNAQESNSSNMGDLSFAEDTIDFGKVERLSNGERTFEFTNTGSKPVVISNVKSTCGCTVPSFTKTPILPGAKGEIKVTYDTKRIGNFIKTLTVISNGAEPNKKLIIKGEVLKDPS